MELPIIINKASRHSHELSSCLEIQPFVVKQTRWQESLKNFFSLPFS
jgi:hypothetical protein